MNNIVNNLPWDVRSTLNKVKNVVMNYTEMESKVREATSNDPWGASSTLLQEIARGTQNYQQFNEIMPTIYKRFAENRSNWRQVYKALQLIEYLLKNGSDRVLDNVRDHQYEIKSLTSFHFVDEKGKDQGINVRHRAKEICELLNDDERLKREREKARATRNKYQGVSADEFRYGGFSSNSYNANAPTLQNNADKYKYEYEYEVPKTINTDSAGDNQSQQQQQPTVIMAETSKSAPTPNNELNLLDLDFGSPSPPASNPSPSNVSGGNWATFAAAPEQQQSSSNVAFADFQSASFGQPPTLVGGFGSPPKPQQQQQQQFQAFANFPPPAAASTASQPQTAYANFTSPPQQPAQPAQPAGFQSFASFPQPQPQPGFANFSSPPKPATNPSPTQEGNWGAFAAAPKQPTSTTPASQTQQQPRKVEDIWSSNLAALDSLAKFNTPQQKSTGPTMNQLASQPPANNNNMSWSVGVSTGHGQFQAAPVAQPQQQWKANAGNNNNNNSSSGHFGDSLL